MDDDIKIKIDMFLGHIEIRCWIEYDGEKLIGMSMEKVIGKDGNIIKCEIKPTGLVVSYV